MRRERIRAVGLFSTLLGHCECPIERWILLGYRKLILEFEILGVPDENGIIAETRQNIIGDRTKERLEIRTKRMKPVSFLSWLVLRLLTRKRQTSFLFVIVNFRLRSKVFNSHRKAISADVVIQKSPLLSTEISLTGVVCPFSQATNSFLSEMIRHRINRAVRQSRSTVPASKHFTVKSGMAIRNSDGFRRSNATDVQLVPVR
jgi:hypothetical protein